MGIDFKSFNLKKAYSSDFDDVLQDFYIPTLEKSIEYNRLAGFFSSSSLAITARGIYGLIKNNGIMKLIVSPRLSKKDMEIILVAHDEPEKYIENKILEELETFENEFIRDHVFALGWMIANGKLEIKIALPYNDKNLLMGYEEIQERGIFHQKVGLFRDIDGNVISFSGSVNETVAGWLGNIEEFKVFRGWISAEKDYVDQDLLKFERFWNNKSPKIRVMDVPVAVKNRLIEIAPKGIEEIKLDKWYKKPKKIKVELYRYQNEAVESWFSNSMKGIYEMATGTGKTFVALGCLDRAYKTAPRLLTVITCPFQHLIQQWKREIEKFGVQYDELIIADSSNPGWKDILSNSLVDISLNYKNKIIVLTTHNTFSSKDFIEMIKSTGGDKRKLDVFLIADEVHGLGAEKRKEGFLEEYGFRLALSATPKRWYDEIGTSAIYNFFDKVVFEFGLEKAINTINPATNQSYLTPYRYKPNFVSLTASELDEYADKTRIIAAGYNFSKNDEERGEFFENILFQRANIIKNAVNKYEILENILEESMPNINWFIIYCSPTQIEKVIEITNKKRIFGHKFTMREGTTPDKQYNGISEREYILQCFAEQKYQVLVAIRCLDEGVDIPPARTSFFMSNSGDPREHIQRLGRVLRRWPGKSESTIYDIIVTPSLIGLPKELREAEMKIFEKELRRYEEIAGIAVNSAEALNVIYDIKRKFMEMKK